MILAYIDVIERSTVPTYNKNNPTVKLKYDGKILQQILERLPGAKKGFTVCSEDRFFEAIHLTFSQLHSVAGKPENEYYTENFEALYNEYHDQWEDYDHLQIG